MPDATDRAHDDAKSPEQEALCDLFRWYADSPLPAGEKDRELRARMAAILGYDLDDPAEREQFERLLDILASALPSAPG